VTTQRPFTGDEIREAFLRFYEERDHLVMPSASLIPAADPTLLLTSAGMAPFKPYYAGDETPPHPRLASVQKCFRATDIDVVGDRTHLTMFEMLGNFSIGDYFKRETIQWAWEFCTSGLELDPARLWVTVHHTDGEAYAIWRDEIGVDESRIERCGDRDNFWGPAGKEGACGPSSEIYYELNPDADPSATPCADDVGRFVEIWNLVFPQFLQAADGTRTDMPAPGIDTGMGLERVAAIMQGVPSAYETDLLRPIVAKVEEISGVRYGADEDTDFAIRVVVEHARSATFLIADGVVPANEGRGYVLRRVIRRGIRFARKLGIESTFLAQVAEAVIERMGARYPELVEHRVFVLRSLEAEEERFDEAIVQGMPLLDEMVTRGGEIAGKDAFLLYDTYGFPLELTQEIAREHGMTVDLDAFEAEMEAQRQRGREGARFGGGRELNRLYEGLGVGATTFLGYDAMEADSVVVGLLKDGEPVQRAEAGDEVEVVLRETPFYPEGGGQVGDTGTLTGSNGTVKIVDTQKPVGDIVVHTCAFEAGAIAVGDTVHAAVDAERRLDIMRNHTATHLLHAVLREILGSHVRQAGSLVAPDRLRFDFTHVAGVTDAELARIERDVNDAVREDLTLVKREEAQREAVARGALAFFGERYGDTVRTIQIGPSDDGDRPISFELCGGTHLERTGQIGTFRIIGESSIGTGVRRIEAVTGRGGDAWVSERLRTLDEVAAKLHAVPLEASMRVDALLAQVEEAKKTASAGARETSRREAQKLLAKAETVDGVTVLAASSDAPDADTLRETGDWLRDKLGSGVVVLGGVFGGRPSVIAMVTQDLVDRGFDAGDVVKAAAQRMGGGGGGRPQLAQAGGREPSQLPDALQAAVAAVRAVVQTKEG
jgi:alanyl-tRNA synthetase